MILKPKILKNVKDVEYMDDFDDWYIFKENPSDYAELPKNMILYGPPGTGKTYHTLLYAVAVIEEKSLSDIVNEPLEDIIKRYHHYKADGLIEFTTFHQSYSYEEFIEGIRPVMTSDSDNVISDVKYKVSSGLFKNFCDRAKQSIQTNHVFIIDEINRGNIAKIFGELITLIEPSKRIGQLEGTYTRLPYSKESFGVPDNIYIIGTMNTSDQNVFTLDTAFQRRWDMRLIENNFENVDPSLADATILDTSVTWKDFCTEINKIVVGNGARMTSAEDKRLGAYFVHLRDLKFDERMGDLSDGEYDGLRKKESHKQLTDTEKARLAEVRDAMKQNRKFPEKVIKYLWDDAFKFNREIIFETTEYQSLEQVIRAFMYAEKLDRFKMFKENVRSAFTNPED